jgi:serine/threonine-protein kinase HipA
MKICPITYQQITEGTYSRTGLQLLSRNLTTLNNLAYTKEEQLHEAAARALKLSIQGVQPKLSAKINVKKSAFELVEKGGTYILKPQNFLFPQLPENEDLTMRLASQIGLEIPLHGMIYSKDNSLTYFIKRFDRFGKNKKIAVEDFAQLAGKNRDTKYNYSMEKLAKIIDEFCTFPAIEKVKIFKLTLFNFLIGNEDMHLKNFSIISKNGKVELSPHYDLINTTIALKNVKEEIALPINGKKNNLDNKLLIEYMGTEVLKINQKIINQSLENIFDLKPIWQNLIEISFLSNDMKEKYFYILNNRWQRIFN